MRAFSVGVLTDTPHGQYITSIFTIAKTRAEALAQGVRHACETAACGPDCMVRVRQAHATEVYADLVIAAADEMREKAA